MKRNFANIIFCCTDKFTDNFFINGLTPFEDLQISRTQLHNMFNMEKHEALNVLLNVKSYLGPSTIYSS